MDKIVSINNLVKNFGDLQIIKGISFDVHKGEVLSIIGPSGSGKSTILRCISQLETVTNGTIEICGKTLVKDGKYGIHICATGEMIPCKYNSRDEIPSFNLKSYY